MINAASFDRTPFLVLDPQMVADRTHAVRAALPEFELFYALKANSHPAVVSLLDKLGVGFEIASQAELEQMVSAGITGPRILCLHPIKSPEFLRRLGSMGVKTLAADCAEELFQIARFAPGSTILIRLAISGTESRVSLEGKFGCPPTEAVHLLLLARQLGLHPAGLTLHVGSQCESPAAWARALALCLEVVADMVESGLRPEWVSMGGGLPVNYSGEVAGLDEIAAGMRSAGLAELVGRCRLTIEPGRALVAAAGTLVASVIGVAERSGDRWIYLDAGIYHGLFEMLPVAGGLPLPVDTPVTDRPKRVQRLAGPTCDGLDVLPHARLLPELRVGDRVTFAMAGAYSSAMAAGFNGFPPPEIFVRQSGSE